MRGLRAGFIALLAPTVSGIFGPFRRADSVDLSGAVKAIKACQLLNESFPVLVSFPGSQQYIVDNDHYAITSEQNSTCSIEPASVEDVSSIIQIIGRSDIRSPFAVKSGGHAYNLGQSSTPGVQISMAKFSNLSYDAQQQTVTLGVGLTWEKVYALLEPLGVMVVGGRIKPVGVGGFSLGGGYSWKSNQYGLLIDTIVSFDLVLPSGEFVHVTNETEPDLFFGLKGGLNNFGIVTEITVEAHQQTEVFGGFLTYSIDTSAQFNEAVSDFSFNNTDPKAQAVVVYTSNGTLFQNQILLFYDGPSPPASVFDKILAVPTVTTDTKTRSFLDLMVAFGDGDNGIGPFGFAQHVAPILKYTIPILEEMVTQVDAFATRLSEANDGAPILVSISPEPFVHPFAHSRGGAYPHDPARQLCPSSSSIAYQEDIETPEDVRAARHATFAAELRNFTETVQAKAVEECQSRWNDILYPNYALPDSPLELVYGSNVPRLQEIAAKYDPDKVMTLTGGFRFQD